MRHAMMVGAGFMELVSACEEPAVQDEPFYFADFHDKHSSTRVAQPDFDDYDLAFYGEA